jgi:2-dehydropantoate 2-reductase
MRILVYGAGVLGSLYAGRLSVAGHDVALLARDARLEELRTYGVVLENAITGERMAATPRIVSALAPADAYDWVLVLVRRNQVPGVLPALADNEHTPNAVFMTNNAAGSNGLVRALGAERVVLGFPGAAGLREGHVVRYLSGVGGRGVRAVVGELDGRTTPRLRQLRQALEEAGMGVRFEPHMEAWLTTHAALVSPIATALYMCGGDIHRLAGTPDALLLMVRAIREGLDVLRTLKTPIRPPILQALTLLPEPVLVAVAGRLLDTRQAEIAVAAHANAARDEMKCLAGELQALALSSGLPTPASDCLNRFLDMTIPPIAPGSKGLAVSWREVWIWIGALALVLGLVGLRRRRR